MAIDVHAHDAPPRLLDAVRLAAISASFRRGGFIKPAG
jgi:hypothetical protein